MSNDSFYDEDGNPSIKEILAWLDKDDDLPQSQNNQASDSKKNPAYEILDQLNHAALIPIPKGQKGPRISVLLQTEMEKPEGSATEWAPLWSPTCKHPAATTAPNKK